MSKENKMFINKTKNGKNNISGVQIATYRKALHLSQRKLADKLQILGLDVDKNAIQHMESGQRFITDIELIYLSKALNVTVCALLDFDSEIPILENL